MQKWGGKNSHSCRFIYQQRADGLGHFFDFSWHWFFPSYPARESFHTSLFFALKNPVTRTVFLAWKTIPLFVQKGQRLLQPVQRLEQKYTRIIHHPDFSISSLFLLHILVCGFFASDVWRIFKILQQGISDILAFLCIAEICTIILTDALGTHLSYFGYFGDFEEEGMKRPWMNR